MKSLVQLQSEIQSLQEQATELRSREFEHTVAEIVQQMAAFGITLAQLKVAMKKAPAKGTRGRKAKGKPGRPKGKAGAKAAPKAKGDKGAKSATRKPAAIKYRGPNGEAWSGRGKTPTWLKAQVEAGKTVDDFKI